MGRSLAAGAPASRPDGASSLLMYRGGTGTKSIRIQYRCGPLADTEENVYRRAKPVRAFGIHHALGTRDRKPENTAQSCFGTQKATNSSVVESSPSPLRLVSRWKLDKALSCGVPSASIRRCGARGIFDDGGLGARENPGSHRYFPPAVCAVPRGQRGTYNPLLQLSHPDREGLVPFHHIV